MTAIQESGNSTLSGGRVMMPSNCGPVAVATLDVSLEGLSSAPDMTVNLRNKIASPTSELPKGESGIDDRFVLLKCPLPPQEEFHLVETFVANAIISPNSTQAYRAIIDSLRRRDDSAMLMKVLLALRTAGKGSTLHQLTNESKKHAHLLHLLFRLDPFTLPPAKSDDNTEMNDNLTAPITDHSLADAHLHLLVALVSANSVFLAPGMNALWRLAHQDLEDAPIERTRRVHAALATLLRLCPKGYTDLFPILASNFPFRTKPAGVLEWYTKQCLQVLEYVPTLHGQVLELLLDKCLEMDVEIKINDEGQVCIDEEKDVHDAEEELFELELDEPKVEKIDDEKKDEDQKVDEMADKLDSLMHILFEHIRTNAESSGSKTFYRMMSPVFDSSILTTHRSKFVQFVLFVVCGLEDREGPSHLDREFAAKLIDIVLDPYRATITRQSGACYLASFISRALYVSPETVCEATSALLRWAEAYMMSLKVFSARTANVQDQCETYSLFYTVCQAAFYMMCFRGSEAMQYYRSAVDYHSKNKGEDRDPNAEVPFADPELVDIGPTRWAKLCGHELQPLRFCLESVRAEFLHVAGVYRLLPSQLLEKLSAGDSRPSAGGRAMPRSPTLITTTSLLAKRRTNGGVGGLGRGSNPLDSFFPFDPYLLRHSYRFVEPFYKNWEGSIDEDDVFNDDVEGDSDDSFAEEISESEDEEDEPQQAHMSQSVDSGAYLQPASYASNATIASNSTKPSFQPGTPEIAGKRESQRRVWSETLKRSRAASIASSEAGSW